MDMECPRCQGELEDGRDDCPRCGVVVSRYRPRSAAPLAWSSSLPAPGFARLRERMFQVEPEQERLVVLGRGILFLGLVIWTIRLLRLPMEGEALMESILHLVNLPFHEAGHVVFSPFGHFLHVLGGTLGQLLVPGIVAGAFLAKGDAFGASVGAWWLGQNFLDCAPYINDARAGQLELLGGVTGTEMPDYHDWQILLGQLDWMRYDHALARLSWATGAVVMVAALAWGGYVVWAQVREHPAQN